MEPVDKRITAAQLMALRREPNGTDAIARLLGLEAMPPRLALRTAAEIQEFVVTGDAVLAAQLIHASMVRQDASSGAAGSHAPGPNQRR